MGKDKTQKVKLEDLLNLLDTPEVRQKIVDIIKESPAEDMLVNRFCPHGGDVSAPSDPANSIPAEAAGASDGLQTVPPESDSANPQNDMSEIQIRELRSENGKLTEDLAAANETIGELEDEKTRLQGENVKLAEDLAAANETIGELEDEKTRLQGENVKLTEDLAAANETIGELEKEKTQLQGENRKLSGRVRSLGQDLAKAENELNVLRDIIRPVQDIYMEYQKLPASIKQNLSSVFTGNSMWSFYFCGMREEALIALWNQWKHLLDQNKEPDESLIKLFYFFVEHLNSIHEVPEYKIVEPEKGSVFNYEIAISDSSGNSQGKVVRVIIPGLSYAKSGRIIKKPIVLVK